MDLPYIGMVLLMVFGFGFVIFWHELGHFLAAKWAGVKVEQFAVGFGNALFSWRKGLGFRWGTSRPEFERRLRDYLDTQRSQDAAATVANAESSAGDSEKPASDELQLEYAAAELGLGETEYRLNWIPLGGYVKMLGQDDMDPNSLSESPRAYNNKPIPKRMVIVSAGVVMNVILAIIFFTILFRIGFDAPPPIVGAVIPGSPAALAGVQVGDRVVSLDGRVQEDFTKIQMNVALLGAGETVPLVVQSPGGAERTLEVTPRRLENDPSGFLRLGIAPSPELIGLDPTKLTEDEKAMLANEPVRPGEQVVAINGQPVKFDEYYKLDEAIQQGKPVELTVKTTSGEEVKRTVLPRFVQPFEDVPMNLAGMMPRTVVSAVEPASSAKGKLLPDDVIMQVVVHPANDPVPHPSQDRLRQVLNTAGQNSQTVEVTVLRDGKELTFDKLDPTLKLEDGKRGLGIGLRLDEDHPIIAGVLDNTPAKAAGIPAGATIESIAGQPVASWYDVLRLLKQAKADEPTPIAVKTDDGQTQTFNLNLKPEALAQVQQTRYIADLPLREYSHKRQTNNPLIAAKWGLNETRDLMMQFYLTIRRMVQGSVAASNAMGPIGIFHQGSKIANRGIDWLIWFLAMISANLAVVNFLPIPIVDGGLFVFLIIEKIMGKPLSPRAQSIAQIVGLALIASVFLFVTYHDIARLWG